MCAHDVGKCVCICACGRGHPRAVVLMWRSEVSLWCQTSPSILFETVSWFWCQASWPVSLTFRGNTGVTGMRYCVIRLSQQVLYPLSNLASALVLYPDSIWPNHSLCQHGKTVN